MADLSHTQTHDAMLKNAAHLSEDAALDDEELGISSSSRRVDFGRDGTTGGVEHGGDGDEAREQRPKHKKRRKRVTAIRTTRYTREGGLGWDSWCC
jgi:hypothetical protein